MKIVVLGLSITSSWGNGHATTYRALLREFAKRGHEVLFLERNVPWYADNRDAARMDYAEVGLYGDLEELKAEYEASVREADAVIVGSYVPEGVAAGRWVLGCAHGPVAFYDIDTPVTIAKVGRGECDYLTKDLIPRYALYLSFSGGPMLRRLEKEFGSPRARPLYCAVDPSHYYAEVETSKRWDLGYLGTYSPDRQPTLEKLLLRPAERRPGEKFVVGGPQYPQEIRWPRNVERIEHLPPAEHRRFYNLQRFTLNVTRADMIAAGYSPSVRLFEAAACGTPVISDAWEGLDSFFEIGREILVVKDGPELERALTEITPAEAREIGRRAQARVLAEHTAAHRAEELELHLEAAIKGKKPERRTCVTI